MLASRGCELFYIIITFQLASSMRENEFHHDSFTIGMYRLKCFKSRHSVLMSCMVFVFSVQEDQLGKNNIRI